MATAVTGAELAVLSMVQRDYVSSKIEQMFLKLNHLFVLTGSREVRTGTGRSGHEWVADLGDYAGVKAIQENGIYPRGSTLQYARLSTKYKTLANSCYVTREALKAAADPTSLISVLDEQARACVDGLLRVVSQQQFLDGTGALATVVPGTYSNHEAIEIQNGWKNLRKNQKVDIYIGDGASPDTTEAIVAAHYFVDVPGQPPTARKYYISLAQSTGAAFSTNLVATEGTKLYLPNSKATAGSQSQMAITGVQHILKNTGTLYGVDRSDTANTWLRPFYVDNTSTTFNWSLWETIKVLWNESGTTELINDDGIRTDSVIITTFAIREALRRMLRPTVQGTNYGGNVVLGWDGKTEIDGFPVIALASVPERTMIFWNKTNCYWVGAPAIQQNIESGMFSWVAMNNEGTKWDIARASGGDRRAAYEAILEVNLDLVQQHPERCGILTNITTVEP